MLVDLGADDAQAAHDVGRAVAHIDLAGDIVKVDPLAVLPGHDALGTEDRAEDAAVELAQDVLDLVQGVFFRGLHAPAGKDLVGVVMMVMMMFVVVLVVIMVMAAAAMVVVVMVIVIVVMMMVMLVIMVLVIVLVVVMVMIAAVLMIMVVFMFMFMLMLVVVMMMLVVMVVAAAAVVVIVLLFGLRRSLGGQLGQLGLEGVLLLHGLQDLLAGELLPGGGDDGGHLVVFPQESHHVPELFVLHPRRAAEDDGAGVLDLVVEELTEVLHIHFALGGVGHGGEAVEDGVLHLQVFDGPDDVGQLAHAGGLDEDAVGVILLHHLAQGPAKVAHQAAADAAGVHLGDLDAGILEEAAVDADLAELIFDEDELFPLIGLADELLDQGRFARAEEAGENIDLCHGNCLFLYFNFVIFRLTVSIIASLSRAFRRVSFAFPAGVCYDGAYRASPVGKTRLGVIPLTEEIKEMEQETLPADPAPVPARAAAQIFPAPVPDKVCTCPPEKAHGHSEAPRTILFLVLILAAAAALVYGAVTWEPQPDIPEILDPAVDGENTSTGLRPVAEMAANDGSVGLDVPGAGEIVARFGDTQLTNQSFIYYYWDSFYSLYSTYGTYLGMYLDFSQPFDQQQATTEQTWNDYFAEMAMETWYRTQVLCQEAREENYELPADAVAYVQEAKDSLETFAAQAGYGSGEEYLRQLFDPSADVDSYLTYIEDTVLAQSYTQEMYQRLYDEVYDPNAQVSYNVNVRHILIAPEEGTDIPDDESAKALAEMVYAQWQEDPTVDNFAALAGEYSSDPGSKDNGGLYEDVTPGQMVTEFNDWCFAEGRQAGDSGIVQTEYGYHIMYLDSFSDTTYADENDDAADKAFDTWTDDLFAREARETFADKITFTEKVPAAQ